MKRFVSLNGLAGLALSASLIACGSAAQASPVSFSIAGNGSNPVQVATFDELPGNALAYLAQGPINAAAALAPGTVTTTGPFTLYYQANLSLIGPNGAIDTGTTKFTALAKFQETATVTSGSNTVTFNMASNQTGSYFDIFALPNGPPANDAAGTGFVGTLIYQALPGTSGYSGNFTNIGGATPIYPGSSQNTVSGSGATPQLSFATSYVNSAYFVGGSAASLPSINFNSSNVLPFAQVAPATSFVDLTGPSGPTTITPVLGTDNGATGRDVQFQADANSTIAVPEPASVAMTCLGLGGALAGGFVARRRASARA